MDGSIRLVGQYPGHPDGVQSVIIGAANMQAAFTNLHLVVVKTGLLSEEEYRTLLEQAKVELPQYGASWHIICAYGVRPVWRRGDQPSLNSQTATRPTAFSVWWLLLHLASWRREPSTGTFNRKMVSM